GDAQLVLAAMAAAQDEREVERPALCNRRNAVAFPLESQVVRPEALDRKKRSVEAIRQPEARPGAEEHNAGGWRRQRQHAALERMEKGPQRILAHAEGYACNAKRARPETAPSSIGLRTEIRRPCLLRPLASSCRARSPCRWSGRPPSWRGGPCRARRS